MWTRALLKENGKKSFMRNYWPSMLVSLIAMAVGTGINGLELSIDTEMQESESVYGEMETVLGGLSFVEMWAFLAVMMIAILIGLAVGIGLVLFVTNVIEVGCSRYFIENRINDSQVSKIFYGFQGGRYGSTVGVMGLRTLYVFLWSLLFIIPGIIKSYSYMLVPYIWAENPSLDKKRIFEMSEKMMYGHKWEAFVLYWSFIWWHLLGMLSFGMLNVFYVNPYLNATYAEFYSALKAEAKAKGIVTDGELSM